MHTLKFEIKSKKNFLYHVYNNDKLLTSGFFDAAHNQYLNEIVFAPNLVNKFRVYALKVTDHIEISNIVFDDVVLELACSDGTFYPIPNEVEDSTTHFAGSHLSRDGFVEFTITWPVFEWYYNWMDKNWATYSRHS